MFFLKKTIIYHKDIKTNKVELKLIRFFAVTRNIFVLELLQQGCCKTQGY